MAKNKKKTEFRTHYDNLKVSQDAPIEVIRAAYKSLSAKYHPDKHNNSPKAQKAMQIINASFDVLSDPEKRKKHDLWIREQENKSKSRNSRKKSSNRDSSKKRPSRSYLASTKLKKFVSVVVASISLLAGFVLGGVGLYYAYEMGAIHKGVEFIQNLSRPALLDDYDDQEQPLSTSGNNSVADNDSRDISMSALQSNLMLVNQFTSQMVNIPPGTFEMGSTNGLSTEIPVHRVSVPGFRMGKFEITFTQWALCVEANGCRRMPNDQGWGQGDRPVINVSSREITEEFLPWLNSLSESRFRLPSEAEWEYAARAGSNSDYSWGGSPVRGRANCSSMCEDGFENSSPVGTFDPNSFGLHDMHGNVWEWTADCYNNSYAGAPDDGSAWSSGDCTRRAVRGGSWASNAMDLRSSARTSFGTESTYYSLGFRIVQSF